MDYTTEDKEDKKYKGKGYTRKEFKKDVGEAVVEAQKGEEKTKKTVKKPKRKYTKKSHYANMTAGELRKLLQSKKMNLLKKSGFPDRKIPRGKDAMISLCIKLKRKRW